MSNLYYYRTSSKDFAPKIISDILTDIFNNNSSLLIYTPDKEYLSSYYDIFSGLQKLDLDAMAITKNLQDKGTALFKWKEKDICLERITYRKRLDDLSGACYKNRHLLCFFPSCDDVDKIFSKCKPFSVEISALCEISSSDHELINKFECVREYSAFYRQSRDTFIRSIGEYGYIKSQLTKHDRSYTQEGRAFLEVLSREPQSLETLAIKACEYFEDVAPIDIMKDLKEFLDSLVTDRYLISGNTAEDCAAKDTYFSYAENPKTLFTYNAQQNPDDEKIYADTQEVLGNYYRRHPQIHSCQIETTSRCNERCIHCYIPHELKNVVLPYKIIENVLQQLHDLGVMGLTLSGGEFFTHPDAEKILRKARELDFSFTILSNITLLTPKMIGVLKEVNPGLVQTSLYSVIPEEHDHITQLNGSCEKTKAAIDALIAANIPVQISCPVMKTNYHSYKEVLKYAYERNCKAQTDYVMMARYDFTTDNLAERLTLEQTEDLLKDIIQFDKDYLNSTDKPVSVVSREEWEKRPFCGVGMDNLCIASDGIVYPCSGWQGMACGNVREQPIKDIWEKSPQLNELRHLTKSAIPQCYNCEDKQFCAPCLVRNFNESGGDYLKVARHFCKAAHLNRKLVEEAKAKMRG